MQSNSRFGFVGGKSLLFMLPAFCGEGGVTIVSHGYLWLLLHHWSPINRYTQVVVPLVTLRQDLH